jgi:hypothetical protein
MKLGPLTFLLLASFPLLAQAPAPGPGDSITHTSAIGFSYTLPADWQVVDFPAPPTLSGIKKQAQQNATNKDEKKGMEDEKKDVSCVQVAFTARHGDPASVIVVVQLPFDCLGQTATEKDLPGFAQGASAQLKQQFDFTEAKQGSYSLGSHSMWIERSKGALRGHRETPCTTEITCTVLKKGAVCWMDIATDTASLHSFEQGQVVLEGDSPTALVPATAFDKKPPSSQ